MNHSYKNLALAALFVALMAVGAYLQIPMPTGVSITLQVMFCLLCGLSLPPVYSLASMFCYVLLGLIGLPVFTFGGGFGAFLQPSFGFLLAFIAIAPLCGILSKRLDARFSPWISMGLACLAAILLMYIIGAAYGYCVMNFYLGKAMSIGAVIWGFCIVFIPFDLGKALLAVFVAERLRKFKLI